MSESTRFVDARCVVGGCWATHGVEADAGGIGETPGGVQRRPMRASGREIVDSPIYKRQRAVKPVHLPTSGLTRPERWA